MRNENELYLSVDIESSGPAPSVYSMLALGACNTEDLTQTFYVEFKPTSKLFVPEALEACKLSLEVLEETGTDPAIGMANFEKWIKEVSRNKHPIMDGFDAPFDWMFVCDYFWRFLDRNPLGISARDIKSYYAGKFDTDWRSTSKSRIDKRFIPKAPHTHNALDDAIEQAILMNSIIDFPGHTL